MASQIRVTQPLTMVGRLPEVGRLRTILRSAIAGSPQVVLVRGEAGIGKTRLVREAMRLATEAGMQTCYGRFIDQGPIPFMAFTSASLPAIDAAGLLDAPSFPGGSELRALSREPAVAGGPAAGHLINALATATVLLGRKQPLLFVVDDLHWAEPDAAPPSTVRTTRGRRPFCTRRWPSHAHSRGGPRKRRRPSPS